MLPHNFFERPTLLVARELLGKLLVRRTPQGTVNGMIVEVESYIGETDRASHAFGGKRTPRTETMFGSPGSIYVYLIYGQNHCFNIVTEDEGIPSAILIRAIEPFQGLELMTERRQQKKPDLKNLCSGPGKLCSSFEINKKLNNTKLSEKTLAVYDFMNFSDDQIAVTPRINVDYAGDCKDYPYRFFVKDNRFISEGRRFPDPTTFGDLIGQYTNSLVERNR